MGESVHNAYIYQIITMYTLNILQQLHLNKAEENPNNLSINMQWKYTCVITQGNL